MSKRVTIGNATFNLPQAGENPPWGEELSDIIEALINASNNTVGPEDILETSALIANNILISTAISRFKFNTATVRSFEAQYYVFRKSSLTTLTESGVIVGVNDDTLGWSISIIKSGEANVDFDIDSTGQIKYTSSSMAGVYDSTNSKIKFVAKALRKI